MFLLIRFFFDNLFVLFLFILDFILSNYETCFRIRRIAKVSWFETLKFSAPRWVSSSHLFNKVSSFVHAQFRYFGNNVGTFFIDMVYGLVNWYPSFTLWLTARICSFHYSCLLLRRTFQIFFKEWEICLWQWWGWFIFSLFNDDDDDDDTAVGECQLNQDSSFHWIYFVGYIIRCFWLSRCK